MYVWHTWHIMSAAYTFAWHAITILSQTQQDVATQQSCLEAVLVNFNAVYIIYPYIY